MPRIVLSALAIFGIVALHSPFAKANPPSTAPSASQPVDPDALSAQDAAVEAKLEKHIDDLRYNAVALSNVLDEIGSKSEIKIKVDWAALERVDVKKDSPVTARLHDIRGAKALELVFKSVQGEDEDHKLGYRIGDGVLHVTTRTELNKRRVTRTIDVTDLMTDTVADRPQTQATGMAGQPIAKGEKLTRNERMDEIKKYLVDNVDTISWKDNGGDVGEITGDVAKGQLTVIQTPEAQRKLKAVLQGLRESLKPEPKNTR
jgi:hypothetical protein